MKDFISKVTFGFLMAQLVPGLIVVSAISLVSSAFSLNLICASEVVSKAYELWISTPGHILLFIALSVGAGMVIHGYHWAVLASHDRSSKPIVCYSQNQRAWFHILFGPVIILGETASLFTFKLDDLTTKENIGSIPSENMQAFNFLQEFYLNFSQFYAHTAYALFFSTILAFIYTLYFGIFNTYWHLPLALYFLTGVFYLLGRIQMLTLFKSERELCKWPTNDNNTREQYNHSMNIKIEQMLETDIDESIELISKAMNKDEARWAKEAFEFYFKCESLDIDSTRTYYVWRNAGKVCGVVGLHRYRWGPPENVWLSWFAVHPDHQRRGIGSAMIDKIEEKAKASGFKKFFIETYDNLAFGKAHRFYVKNGFSQMGAIENYLPDGSSMIVFGKMLSE